MHWTKWSEMGKQNKETKVKKANTVYQSQDTAGFHFITVINNRAEN